MRAASLFTRAAALAWLLVSAGMAGPCFAQAISAPGMTGTPAPIMMPVPEFEGPLPALAQAPPPPPAEPLPIDLTPVRLPERAAPFQALRSDLLYRLPGRLFFSAVVENTLRLETNVFQTYHHNKADGIYRVLPNITLGYALTPRTRVSCNYFFLRDTYMRNHELSRNIHSVGFQINQDFPINARTNVTAGFFGRELFITDVATNADTLNDLIPSLVVTRRVGQRGVVYASVLGQIRFRKFLGRFQEGDEFYSIGGIYRRNRWSLIGDCTVITNFGNSALRGGHNNQNLILTLEAGRQIVPRFPLTAFVRAEPIFNTGANSSAGFAGVNVRIYGGIRAELYKPAIFPIRLTRG